MTITEVVSGGSRAYLALVTDSEAKTPLEINDSSFPVKVFAVWGPAGSPGKSTIASNIACELALLGQRVLLIDLDTLSPSTSIALGLVETPAGLSACLRLADQGRFTSQEYHRLTVSLQMGRTELRFMPGLTSPARWPEVSYERVRKMLQSIESQLDFVVMDLPQATEFNPNLAHPSAMARTSEVNRDSLLRDVLAKCMKLIVVSGADPIAAHRFLMIQDYLKECAPRHHPYTVVNRFRTTALGSRARAEIEETYLSLAKVRIDAFVPDEPENFDRALLNGIPLALLKRSSPARHAISDLARQLLLDSASGEVLAKLS